MSLGLPSLLNEPEDDTMVEFTNSRAQLCCTALPAVAMFQQQQSLTGGNQNHPLVDQLIHVFYIYPNPNFPKTGLIR
jgi:hypothetical protein